MPLIEKLNGFSKVAILGGSGAFGIWYARFFSLKGAEVLLWSRHFENCKSASQQVKLEGRSKVAGFGVHGGDGGGRRRGEVCACKTIKECVEAADLVLLCVPIDAVEHCAQEAAKYAKKGALLADFASVKKEAVLALEKISKSRRDLELASVHPMHGPRAESVAGVAVVFIPVKAGEKYAKLLALFESEGARAVESSAKEHDEVLSVVQGLTHFACICAAQAIRDSGVEVGRARDFSSPLFDVFLSAVARVVLQNPELFAKIQVENPANKKLRKIFASKARELKETADSGNWMELSQRISECAKSFSNAQELLFESDKATLAMNAEARRLLELVGKKVALENVAAKAVHYGVLKAVLGKKVFLTEKSRELSLNVSNARLLGKSEFYSWRSQNVPVKSRDYSVVVPKNADAKTVACAVNKMIGAIKCVQVVSEFEGAQVGAGKKSVTVRCLFFEDEDLKQLNEDIAKLVSSLGFSLR